MRPPRPLEARAGHIANGFGLLGAQVRLAGFAFSGRMYRLLPKELTEQLHRKLPHAC